MSEKLKAKFRFKEPRHKPWVALSKECNFDYKGYSEALEKEVEELREFIKEVSEWSEDYSSTLIKLRAKELLKQIDDH